MDYTHPVMQKCGFFQDPYDPPLVNEALAGITFTLLGSLVGII